MDVQRSCYGQRRFVRPLRRHPGRTSTDGHARGMSQQGSVVVKSITFVDGHNVLYALRARFASQLLDGHPGAVAREALVEQLVNVFDKSGHEVRVYFDGGKARTEQRSAQVWVIYPGGLGDQRADRAILTALREQVGPDAAGPNAAEHASVCEASEPAAMRVVVTRDIRLAKRARRRGATVIDPAAFFAECDAGRLP
jgi:hypothetical protein